eukprot:gene1457-1672_t
MSAELMKLMGKENVHKVPTLLVSDWKPPSAPGLNNSEPIVKGVTSRSTFSATNGGIKSVGYNPRENFTMSISNTDNALSMNSDGNNRSTSRSKSDSDHQKSDNLPITSIRKRSSAENDISDKVIVRDVPEDDDGKSSDADTDNEHDSDNNNAFTLENNDDERSAQPDPVYIALKRAKAALDHAYESQRYADAIGVVENIKGIIADYFSSDKRDLERSPEFVSNDKPLEELRSSLFSFHASSDHLPESLANAIHALDVYFAAVELNDVRTNMTSNLLQVLGKSDVAPVRDESSVWIRPTRHGLANSAAIVPNMFHDMTLRGFVSSVRHQIDELKKVMEQTDDESRSGRVEDFKDSTRYARLRSIFDSVVKYLADMRRERSEGLTGDEVEDEDDVNESSNLDNLIDVISVMADDVDQLDEKDIWETVSTVGEYLVEVERELPRLADEIQTPMSMDLLRALGRPVEGGEGSSSGAAGVGDFAAGEGSSQWVAPTTHGLGNSEVLIRGINRAISAASSRSSSRRSSTQSSSEARERAIDILRGGNGAVTETVSSHSNGYSSRPSATPSGSGSDRNSAVLGVARVGNGWSGSYVGGMAGSHHATSAAAVTGGYPPISGVSGAAGGRYVAVNNGQGQGQVYGHSSAGAGLQENRLYSHRAGAGGGNVGGAHYNHPNGDGRLAADGNSRRQLWQQQQQQQQYQQQQQHQRLIILQRQHQPHFQVYPPQSQHQHHQQHQLVVQQQMSNQYYRPQQHTQHHQQMAHYPGQQPMRLQERAVVPGADGGRGSWGTPVVGAAGSSYQGNEAASTPSVSSNDLVSTSGISSPYRPTATAPTVSNPRSQAIGRVGSQQHQVPLQAEEKGPTAQRIPFSRDSHGAISTPEKNTNARNGNPSPASSLSGASFRSSANSGSALGNRVTFAGDGDAKTTVDEKESRWNSFKEEVRRESKVRDSDEDDDDDDDDMDEMEDEDEDGYFDSQLKNSTMSYSLMKSLGMDVSEDDEVKTDWKPPSFTGVTNSSRIF